MLQRNNSIDNKKKYLPENELNTPQFSCSTGLFELRYQEPAKESDVRNNLQDTFK